VREEDTIRHRTRKLETRAGTTIVHIFRWRIACAKMQYATSARKHNNYEIEVKAICQRLGEDGMARWH
jgi:hypothetical protein